MNKIKTAVSKLRMRGSPFPPGRRSGSLGRSAPWRLRLGLLCALVGRGGGGGAAGRGGWGCGGGADHVGGADGAVLDGLVLGAPGDGHLLAALILVRDVIARFLLHGGYRAIFMSQKKLLQLSHFGSQQGDFILWERGDTQQPSIKFSVWSVQFIRLQLQDKLMTCADSLHPLNGFPKPDRGQNSRIWFFSITHTDIWVLQK